MFERGVDIVNLVIIASSATRDKSVDVLCIHCLKQPTTQLDFHAPVTATKAFPVSDPLVPATATGGRIIHANI